LMTQKAETLLWARIKAKVPPHWNTTRIENRFGGGVPDVHVCAEGVPFWMELKVTKTNAINISPHQIAWNHAYCQAGGVSFFLIHPLLSHGLYLFDGIKGRELAKSGLRGISLEPGSGVVPLWSGESESGLLVGALEIARSRVGSGSVGSGSGSKPSLAPASWPGPGV